MNTNIRTRITAAATIALGGTAIAIGAITAAAPASAKPFPTVTSIQPTCEQNPGAYATGAVRGVYSTQQRGVDRDQICKVYDPAGKLLGTYTSTDYGYYTLRAPGVPPVASSR